MLFNSFDFLVFFVVVWGVYVSLQRRWQNLGLLTASYLFYGAWDPRFLGLVVLSTVVDYACGLGIGSTRRKGRRRWMLAVSLATNLGILGFFKYYDFFAQSLVRLTDAWFPGWSPPYLDLVLPVGISFYTFQTMSYTIDVYRRRVKPCTNLADFALYVSFFPQLVAGPIERAREFLPQIRGPHRITTERMHDGMWLVLFGLFKKVVIADNLAPIADAIFDDPGSASGIEVLLGVYAFAFQIYGDFSGYTDIARGIAKFLGFDLRINFRQPYFATNPSDFWQRWHISLSTWLRDYLYIPLGGSRGTLMRTARNLMITMILGGLWHGAAWNFVAWGLFHGAILVGYRAYANRRDQRSTASTGRLRWLAALAFFHVTCVGWILFRVENLADVGVLVGALTTDVFSLPDPNGFAARSLWFVALVGPLLWIHSHQARPLETDPSGHTRPLPSLTVGLRCALGISIWWVISLCGVTNGDAFIYFQF
ncbi:MAG: MBOAT family protein [Planctomycetota bacterium]